MHRDQPHPILATAQMVAHLPGVVLDDQDVELAGGRVSTLTFDEWLAFDPNYRYERKSYERTQPAFWLGNVTFVVSKSSGALDPLRNAAEAILRDLHRAFLIGPRLPWLPTPGLSVHYLRVGPPEGDEDCPVQMLTYRVLGSMERESLLFGSDFQLMYDRLAIAEVNARWAQMRAQVHEPPSLRSAWSTLERTARPDVWWGSPWRQNAGEFLQCVACCESWLLGDESEHLRGESTMSILDRFANTATELDQAHGNGHPELRTLWADVYRLRTALIHGRVALHHLDARHRMLLSEPRRLLALIVRSKLEGA
jgi:hypothetical protein